MDLRTKKWTVVTQYNGIIVETQTVWSDSAEQASAYALHRNQSKLETTAIPGPEIRAKRDRQAEWESVTGKQPTEEDIMKDLGW